MGHEWPVAESRGEAEPAPGRRRRLQVSEGAEVTAVDLISEGKVSFVVNTPQGRGGRTDGERIRKAANVHQVSSVTTVEAALAAMQGLAEQANQPVEVRSTQE